MDDNKKYWVALNLGVGQYVGEAKKVIDHFSRIDELFKASIRELVALGINKKIAARLLSSPILKEADKELKRAEKKQYFILTWEDEQYPVYLREIFDPPGLLYGAGQVEVLNEPSVAIVGSRHPSP
ncbi:MAG: DNA-processing protein DprA, partial [Candidatus Aminicenantales bacterium]